MNRGDPAALWVLDTNVVLDLLVFDDPQARPLREALATGRVRCAVSEATLEEWRRVLAYPEFALDALRQAELFASYERLAVPLARLAPPTALPRCSDPDDQKFLELAAAGASALVSKDRALLRLRRRCAAWFRIVTPVEAARLLAA